MSRINFLASFGMLLRFESHVEKSRKISGPRSLQNSHFFYICPVDTPDGENCGLVKNLASLTRVTVEEDDRLILNIIGQLGALELGLFDLRDMNSD